MQDKILISVAGASGRMGRMLIKAISETPETSLCAATCHPSENEIIGQDAGLLSGINKINVKISPDPKKLLLADVIIDFTTPEVSVEHCRIAKNSKIAHVIGTTGLSEEQEKELKRISVKKPIVYASNMSVGVNLLSELVEKAVLSLGNGWDIEILEMHHRNKIDAPSGTALSLGKAAAKAKNENLNDIAKFTRYGQTGVRSNDEIGFAVMRGGSVVGDHAVVLSSGDERIELTHKAGDRSIFASGAVRAAIWLQNKKNGLYSMKDVLGL